MDHFIFLAFNICKLQESHELFSSLVNIAYERGSEPNASATAQYNLGLMYMKGYVDPRESGKPNYKAAERYFYLASNRNFSEAFCNLGVMCAEGYIDKLKNGKPNYDIASDYFSFAADWGSLIAYKGLQYISKIQGEFAVLESYHEAFNRRNACGVLIGSREIYSKEGKYETVTDYIQRYVDQGNIKAQYDLWKIYHYEIQDTKRFYAAFPLLLFSKTGKNISVEQEDYVEIKDFVNLKGYAEERAHIEQGEHFELSYYIEKNQLC